MKKDNLQIFNIDDGYQEAAVVEKLFKMLDRKQYIKVIEGCKKAIKKYPGNKFLYIMISISYCDIKQFQNSLLILEEAEKVFGVDGPIKYHFALTYEKMNEFELAEQYFDEALSITPDDENENKSDILNDLGSLLMMMQRDNEAIERWKAALKENPKNKNAEKNLRQFNNIFSKDALSNQVPADIELFNAIQIQKYLESKNQTKVKDESELRKVIGKIIEIWNNEISHQHAKLDSLTEEQKVAWFIGIQIDFDKPSSSEFKDLFMQKDLLDDDYISEADTEAELQEMVEMFPFLTKETIIMLPFASPAVIAAGINEKRFYEIIESGDYNSKEEELLDWGVELAIILVNSVTSKSAKEIKEYEDMALEYAEDFLTRPIAQLVIETIKFALSTDFRPIINEQTQNPTQRKK